MRIKYGINVIYNNDSYYKDNESLREFGCIKNYKFNGEYKVWRSNGEKWIHCYYKNDNKDCEYIKWRNNDQVEIYSYYKNDKRDGEFISYFDNGIMYAHILYKDGVEIKKIKAQWY